VQFRGFPQHFLSNYMFTSLRQKKMFCYRSAPRIFFFWFFLPPDIFFALGQIHALYDADRSLGMSSALLRVSSSHFRVLPRTFACRPHTFACRPREVRKICKNEALSEISEKKMKKKKMFSPPQTFIFPRYGNKTFFFCLMDIAELY